MYVALLHGSFLFGKQALLCGGQHRTVKVADNFDSQKFPTQLDQHIIVLRRMCHLEHLR